MLPGLYVRPAEPRRDPSLSWLIALAVAFGFVYGVLATLVMQSLWRLA